MLENFVQLLILFFVIFDPLASFVVFFTATKKMKKKEIARMAFYSVLVASLVSFTFLLLGQSVLSLFNTSLNDFKVAGGIILGILGVKMTLGHSLMNVEEAEGNSSRAVAALIGTPLLTGPAAISAIIISVSDYGTMTTGAAILAIMAFTFVLFYESYRINKFVGKTAIHVLSTILGLITLAWGIGFVRAGLGF
ncbi:MAG: MarC family protein [archaeon]